MVSQRERMEPGDLAAEIRGGLNAEQLGLDAAAFEQLSQNIARAIQRAIANHVEALHRAEAHFGEEPRE